MQKKPKDLEYYMKLRYRMEILEEEDGGYFIKIPDLPGCVTFCDEFDQINKTIEDAKKAWLEMSIEGNLEIPEPKKDREFSGKFLLRLPKSLHRKLSSQAEEESVSLNQHILNLLSGKYSAIKIIKEVRNIITDTDRPKKDNQPSLVESTKQHGGFFTSRVSQNVPKHFVDSLQAENPQGASIFALEGENTNNEGNLAH